MDTDTHYDVPCDWACDTLKRLVPDFERDQCVICSHCGEPMLPNLSTEDEDGYGWTCINVSCEEGQLQMSEVEEADLVAVGVPAWVARPLAYVLDALGTRYEEEAR